MKCLKCNRKIKEDDVKHRFEIKEEKITFDIIICRFCIKTVYSNRSLAQVKTYLKELKLQKEYLKGK